MDDDMRKDHFLDVDRLSAGAREKAYAELRNGHLIIEQLHTTDDGKKMSVPEGLIHHWLGIVFIPHATLLQTLAFLQDAITTKRSSGRRCATRTENPPSTSYRWGWDGASCGG